MLPLAALQHSGGNVRSTASNAQVNNCLPVRDSAVQEECVK
jgi:hypothetical protein